MKTLVVLVSILLMSMTQAKADFSADVANNTEVLKQLIASTPKLDLLTAGEAIDMNGSLTSTWAEVPEDYQKIVEGALYEMSDRQKLACAVALAVAITLAYHLCM